MENILTKELAWFYRIVHVKEDDDSVELLVDESKFKEDLSIELEIIFGKRVILKKVGSSEVERELTQRFRSSRGKGTEEKKNEVQSDLLSEVIEEAISLKSSDIHFEIYEDYTRVRYRLDGVLIQKRRIEKELYLEFVNIIKIKSNLDITEKRLPQDGRTKLEGYDIRVSVIPTQFGEKIVMRVLGKSTDSLDLNMLGFDKDELKRYLEAVQKSNGIVLISGPTGSGKTTTLYATLKMLNSVEKNIMTIEDPIEYVLDGVNQMQLNEDIGLTFSNALRSFLRQDPDIIMLGEIRDKETSSMAIRASLTGHLVLSTIHTNSALGTISRLVEMGISPFLLSETINVTLAQRLVRKLCDCKSKVAFNRNHFPSTYNLSCETGSYFKEVGCKKCHYTGFSGRRAIYEIVIVDRELAIEISKETNDFNKILKKRNIKTLADKAFDLVMKGETTPSEVYPILINAI
ncbi:type IV pilus assembly protein PilB [Tenacibaculum sp. MAR_2009_124]|uniref:GspE/PulE family protein n=1 Tax=Tenacibaculum sp. MAR_2009_124 TaxID=1250059 RepID=UPI00089B55FA|nr:GspE/PulE family protein [Tenacibaculum sp. MAR_2009_124]SEC56604.1 type IV pilus assembly protein PilB [Tenacibaculum sp. MAR_2009_124]